VSRQHIAPQQTTSPTAAVAGQIRPGYQVVGAGTQPPPHRPMLLHLERELGSGVLKDSELGPLVLEALRQETELRLVDSFNPNWMTDGIRLGDFYFTLVRPSAGMRDWQRDFAKTATPILVWVARSFRRSADVHAAIIKLLERLAQKLRLTVVWPDDPDELNDLKNSIYRECLNAHQVESDDVLVVLNGITITGPG
jgi:hypothetical protein